MSAATLTRKGQVTIPKSIRDRLGIQEGEKVLFVVRGEEVVLKVLRGKHPGTQRLRQTLCPS